MIATISSSAETGLPTDRLSAPIDDLEVARSVRNLPRALGRGSGPRGLARTVDTFSRRHQLQEQLTSQIADTLMQHLDARGALVVIEAEYLCMKIRGVHKSSAAMVTSAVRGVFKDNTTTRAEALSLLRRPS